MKSIKQNVLKGVIGIACTTLPLQNAKAQSDKTITITNDAVFGAGASYTMLEQNNVHGFGAAMNVGIASSFNKPNSKFYGCAEFLLSGDVSQFNTKDRRYKVGYTLKAGCGYNRVALMYVKESGIFIDNKPDRISTISARGAGMSVALGAYTKLYGDFLWSWPRSNNSIVTQSDIVNQKYIARIGIIHTMKRRINHK